jgi:diguanylate cyclase (GGDEF)-like protein
MLKLRGLSARIVIAVVLLVAVLQAAVFVLVSRANHENARDRASEELVIGELAFGHVLEEQRQQLRAGAVLLAADPAMRDLLGSDVRAARERLAARAALTPASVVQVLDVGGLRATLELGTPTARARALPRLADDRLLAEARHNGSASALVAVDGHVYEAVVAPMAGETASLVLALAYDDGLARELQKLTSLGTVLVLVNAQGEARAIGSSLAAGEAARIAAALARPDGARGLAAGDAGHVYRTRDLAQVGGARVQAVLQRSLADVLPAFERLRPLLLGAAGGGVLLALLASLALAHALTRPLRTLTEGAQRIRDGNYREPIQVRGADEIGVLADSLNHMRQSIAAREEENLKLAYSDALTGLPNRSRVVQRIEEGIAQGLRERAKMAVILLDLDRFKQINDTLGHRAGDAVLVAVARRINLAVRPADTVSRLGGDEFAVALPGAGADIARAVADRITLALKAPVEHDGQPIDIGASLGIAVFPEHGSDVDTLLRCADIAMYAAKRNHATKAVYDASHEVARREHLSLLSELRRAVEQSQLRAYYQPKIDIASGRVMGAEALVRWRHPERGLLSPAEFMPYAEQTGYIRVVTRWMLAVTLRQCGAWAAAGLPMQVAINLSVRDLVRHDLVSAIDDLLHAHKVPPHLVCLEITESSFMQDPERAMDILRDLHGLGVHLSIDDFGTGFSSLTYMKQLPVHELKIDQTFVQGMATSDKDVSIVRSTIQLAHNLGLKVVAEGVEDERCLARLRELRCDLAQGFLLGRPMRRAAFEEWARTRSRPRPAIELVRAAGAANE